MKKFLLSGLTISLFAFCLTGCGSSTSSTTEATEISTEEATEATTEAVEEATTEAEVSDSYAMEAIEYLEANGYFATDTISDASKEFVSNHLDFFPVEYDETDGWLQPEGYDEAIDETAGFDELYESMDSYTDKLVEVFNGTVIAVLNETLDDGNIISGVVAVADNDGSDVFYAVYYPGEFPEDIAEGDEVNFVGLPIDILEADNGSCIDLLGSEIWKN